MRNSFRALVVVTGVPAAALLATTTALAAVPASVHTESASDPGPGLTAAETLGIFVGIPALVIAVVYLVVYAATSRKGPKYPAAAPWDGPALWFGAPEQPEQALESATPTADGGGARGQW